MSTDRDLKIEKINAYRKLLDTSVKQVTKNSEIQAEVQAEYISFIEDKLNEMMGDGASPDKLNGEEIQVLKILVANAQRKALDPTTPAKKVTMVEILNNSPGTTVVEKKAKTEPPQQGYVPRNAQPPLGNRTTEGGKPGPNQGILDQLDAMDKKFEKEW